MRDCLKSISPPLWELHFSLLVKLFKPYCQCRPQDQGFLGFLFASVGQLALEIRAEEAALEQMVEGEFSYERGMVFYKGEWDADLEGIRKGQKLFS